VVSCGLEQSYKLLHIPQVLLPILFACYLFLKQGLNYINQNSLELALYVAQPGLKLHTLQISAEITGMQHHAQ
jgi:hypothetical protein